jgi:TolB-like protein/Flp pilus assembly protein TadD
MASIWAELKQRSVVKVAVAYAIVAWLIMQVVATFFPALNLPAWTITFVAALLLIGFPVALLLAWAFELTPEGIKPTNLVTDKDRISRITGRKLDFAIIGALVLALSFVVYNYVLEDPDQEVVTTEMLPTAEAVTEGQDSVVVEEQPETLPNSVAVLPFDNLSPDPDEAYFATGLHDEILNQLAKLSSLSVISRTSVLRYADSDLSIPEIAKELNVGTVMEGSVRYADNRVRITIQLIDAATDEHLWSETYEREFADIFAIESDIAMNIANALEAEFSPEEQGWIQEITTDSPEAYALYLQAISIFAEAPSGGGMMRNRSRLQPLFLAAIDIDPEFSLAYRWLAWIHAAAGEEARALEYADKTLELDPNSGEALSAISFMYYRIFRFEEALEFGEQAARLNDRGPTALLSYARALAALGRGEESLGVLDRLRQLDPTGTGSHQNHGVDRWQVGDRDGGLAATRRAVERAPEATIWRRELGAMEGVLGNRTEALAQINLAGQLQGDPNFDLAYSYLRAGLHDEAERLMRKLAEAVDLNPLQRFYYHLAVNDEDQALTQLAQLVESPPPAISDYLIHTMLNPYDYPTLEQPEFQGLRAELRAKIGWLGN